MLTQKLDIMTAIDAGYRIALHADGVADVIRPDGQSYGVDLTIGERGVCTCPDFQVRGGSYNGHCKHQWWVSQLTTCTYCHSPMVLVGEIYECINGNCNAAKSLGLIKEQRAERRAERVRRVA